LTIATGFPPLVPPDAARYNSQSGRVVSAAQMHGPVDQPMNAVSQSPTPKPRRRWLQFSLRTLMVLMLAVGCGFGWLGMKVKEARDQREAVEVIRRFGGHVTCVAAPRNTMRTAATWVGRLFGEDLSEDVISVSFEDAEVTDDGLRHLKAFGQLRRLSLSGAAITDNGLKYLDGLSQLERLELGRKAPWFVDSDLSQQSAARQGGTRITDGGLAHLEELRRLKTLYLVGTEVTDMGLQHLEHLNELEWLNLSHTRVTDAGLEHLKGLIRLRQLYLTGTKVTDGGVRDLKRALPKCWIDFELAVQVHPH
jgi:hypothetical protein